jgi:iron complex outermembrane receptor protein
LGIAALCVCSNAIGADESTSGETGPKNAYLARDSEMVQTVVVTAERRSKSLQQVPLSIQAFTAEELEKSGTGAIMDLQMHTPGLVMNSFGGHGEIFMRGVGNAIQAPGLEGSVAVYVDGVYQPRPLGALFGFVDVERVEVLKGPQGTLYGRNATGGAINIVSKAASRTVEGQADVQFGNFNQKVVRGTISGPLSEGAAYGRLSATVNKDDGYVQNIFLNTRAMQTNLSAMRGSVEFTPTSKLNVVINANYNQNDMNPLIKLTDRKDMTINPAYTRFNAIWVDDPYKASQDTLAILNSRQSGLNATIKYDMDWARLTSVTATGKQYANLPQSDNDGTEVRYVIVGPVMEDTKFISQDFILASASKGPWQWTTLASFMHQTQNYEAKVFLPVIAPNGGVLQDGVGNMSTNAMGIGGQASYALGNGVTLTAGTRYSKESKENNEVLNATVAGNKSVATQNDKKSWTAWTPKLVAEYAPNKDLMWYATSTKGFKSGGYNAQAIGPVLDPEYVTNYEAGLKSTWLGGKLRVNASAFDMKYDNMQLQFSTKSPVTGALVTVTTNAAKSTSKGLELDFAARPAPRLEVSGGIQVLRAEYDEFSAANPLNPAEGVISRAGNPLPRAPHVTANLGVQYTWPSAFEGTDVTLRVDGYHRSRTYYSPFNDPLASEELGFIGNVQLSFEPAGLRGLYGAVFVRNFTDKVYHLDVQISGTAGYGSFVAPPRTYGAQLGYKF